MDSKPDIDIPSAGSVPKCTEQPTDGTCRSQELETQCRSSVLVSETQLLEPSLLSLRICISKKLYLGIDPKLYLKFFAKYLCLFRLLTVKYVRVFCMQSSRMYSEGTFKGLYDLDDTHKNLQATHLKGHQRAIFPRMIEFS